MLEMIQNIYYESRTLYTSENKQYSSNQLKCKAFEKFMNEDARQNLKKQQKLALEFAKEEKGGKSKGKNKEKNN